MKLDSYKFTDYYHKYIVFEADDLTDYMKERIKVTEKDCYMLCSCFVDQENGLLSFNVLSIGASFDKCTKGLKRKSMLAIFGADFVMDLECRIIEPTLEMIQKNKAFIENAEKDEDEDLMATRFDNRIDDVRDLYYPDIVSVGILEAPSIVELDMKIKMCLINAGKIEFAADDKLEELGVTYETVATTTDKAFVRTNFDTKSSSRTEQDSAIVGAYVNKKISDDKNSQLIIYSNELFASNVQVLISSQYYTYAVELYNNEDVILNSISHLTEREDTIVIRKTNESETYSVTDQEDVVIKTIIFVVPIMMIFTGIVVWIFRRRNSTTK